CAHGNSSVAIPRLQAAEHVFEEAESYPLVVRAGHKRANLVPQLRTLPRWRVAVALHGVGPSVRLAAGTEDAPYRVGDDLLHASDIRSDHPAPAGHRLSQD